MGAGAGQRTIGRAEGARGPVHDGEANAVWDEQRWSNAFGATLQVRNLFDRDNRQPSLPGSWGGIPDEGFGIGHLELRL